MVALIVTRVLVLVSPIEFQIISAELKNHVYIELRTSFKIQQFFTKQSFVSLECESNQDCPEDRPLCLNNICGGKFDTGLHLE